MLTNGSYSNQTKEGVPQTSEGSVQQEVEQSKELTRKDYWIRTGAKGTWTEAQ